MRAFPNARQSAVNCDASRSRSVIAFADISTFIPSPLEAGRCRRGRGRFREAT